MFSIQHTYIFYITCPNGQTSNALNTSVNWVGVGRCEIESSNIRPISLFYYYLSISLFIYHKVIFLRSYFKITAVERWGNILCY